VNHAQTRISLGLFLCIHCNWDEIYNAPQDSPILPKSYDPVKKTSDKKPQSQLQNSGEHAR
jgi:hypothetical protein